MSLYLFYIQFLTKQKFHDFGNLLGLFCRHINVQLKVSNSKALSASLSVSFYMSLSLSETLIFLVFFCTCLYLFICLYAIYLLYKLYIHIISLISYIPIPHIPNKKGKCIGTVLPHKAHEGTSIRVGKARTFGHSCR